MLSLAFSMAFQSEKTNGIFEKLNNNDLIKIDVSGSSRQHINYSLQMTKPEYSIYQWNKIYDWCSNCYSSFTDHPWISYSIEKRMMKINGYFIRAGCCYYADGCCCEANINYCSNCCLYSWSLQISNDNKTWTDVHRIEKDQSFRNCKENIYKFDKEYITKYVRIFQNEACPGDLPCIALNRFDLYGEILSDDYKEDVISFHDDDDDVSIIGHISKSIH